MPKLPLLTIICPVFNEEDCIPLFFNRLKAVTDKMKDKYSFELIFTNNASQDKTLEKILDIRKTEPWVQVITLSRNFGYQSSLMSGLKNAAGEAIIIIDVDCEDPPEMIPQFIEKWEQGYDIVYGERVKRNEPRLIQLARKFFYRLTKSISDSDFILDMAEFSLFTKEVRDAITFNKSSYPFIRSEIGYAGFKRYKIPYTRETRVSGKTHYNFIGMSLFAIGGILSSSTFPLRLVVYTGMPLLILNITLILLALSGSEIPIIPIILLNMSVLLIAAMTLSIYLARTYKDGVNKPLFIINENESSMNRAIVNYNSNTR